MNKTLSVAAIKHGTVIDHITAGQALKLIKLLKLNEQQNPVTIGLNLPSKTTGRKDIIKIENFVLTDQLAHEVSVFAPAATINLINDFQVYKKIQTKLPSEIKVIFTCANRNCITQQEKLDTHFYIKSYGKKINLVCHFCEKSFDLDDMQGSTL